MSLAKAGKKGLIFVSKLKLTNKRTKFLYLQTLQSKVRVVLRSQCSSIIYAIE